MFERVISTQIEDEGLARKARLLNILVIGLATATPLFLVIIAIYGPTLSSILPMVVISLICSLVYWLNKTARVQIAVYVFIVGFALIVTTSMLLPGSVAETKTVAPYFYSLSVVAAGVMIAPLAGFWLATLDTLLFLGIIAVAGGPLAFASSERLGSALSVIAAPVLLSYILAITSWLFGNSLNQALQRARQSASDLSDQLRSNELLIGQLQETTHENELLIGQLHETADRLSPTAEELSALMEEMNVSAEQTSYTVQQMAQGAETQASQVEAVSKSIEQMAGLTREIAASAETVDAASVQAREMVNDSAQALRALGERAQEISKIVEIVDKFADQTNLLALNAAIEAARAGEYGKGFAVVADEVRRLAESSSRSVGEIAELSEGIQQGTDRVLHSMDEVIQAVEETAELAQGISQATSRQRADSEKIVGSTNEVATVAEENAAGAEETAAAIEEQTASMEQIATAAQELAEMASSLQNLVARFKMS